ncbi:hypothetical protein LZZ85_22755 [Terrimonas sp. NA20]|uniref:Type IX secretion system membrane protein PorP/SprF n=1 Tax=Terrimonas ginsenosidimutans TaxID=2908004 RepID=A0ABS9KXT1_9BACT|nr:hypothetical protein [Terrimonas ginsenosidimutans]MCG2617134.1 hypothetical protein [Terrimonas ginsenosidimutans]
MALLFRPGNLSVLGTSTGFAGYRLSRFSLAAGRKLGEGASLAIRGNYHQLKIGGYGTAASISPDAGLILHFSDKLHFAMQLLNPAGSNIHSGVYIPGVYSAGIGYDQSDQLYISAEVVKEQSHPLNAVLGLQYEPVPPLLVRVLMQTREPSFVFGAGYTKGDLRIDLYSSWHTRLGTSGGLQVYWLWKKNAKSDVVAANHR